MKKVVLKSLRLVLPTVALVFGSAATVYAATAQSNVMMKGKLFGNIPNVTVRGIQAGGAPWVIQGSYQLTRTSLVASGKWFIIPTTGFLANGKPIPKKIAGTTAGFPTVMAAITFANSPTIYTHSVSLSKTGDFKMDIKVKIPANAADPVVLIGPGKNGKELFWWASSNFLMDYGQYSASNSGGMASGSSW